MKKSTRALLGLVVIDLLLLAGTFWLVMQVKSGASATTVPPEEAIATITSTMGSVIGVVTAVLLVVWFVRWRKGE